MIKAITASCSVLLFLLISVVTAQAEIELREGIMLDLEFRPRIEFDNRDFNDETGFDNYTTVRSRLGIRFDEIVPGTEFYFMIGDSRMMGFHDPFNMGVPSGPNNWDNNLGIIKAYVLLKDPGCPGINLKIGRMSNDQARARIFGPGNWNLYGPRTYDGLKIGYAHPDLSCHLWHFYGSNGDRHWYPDSTQSKMDHTLTGVDVSVFDEAVNLLAFLDLDQLGVMDTTSGVSNIRTKRITIAAYSGWKQYKDRGISIDIDLAYQTGNEGLEWGNADIDAYLFAGDISYVSPCAMKPGLGLGWDLISGDRNPSDLKINSFYEAYYSKHRFQGDMDLFKSANSYNRKNLGLRDYILRGWISVHENVKLRADGHLFRVEYSYPSAIDGSPARCLGQELDTSLEYKLNDGVKLKAAFDIFLPSNDWLGRDADPGIFIYSVMTCSF